ncbi:hypothetical protein QC762_0004760 [Podospora pseudocomata]|uniref:Uncharacterized protein n=1 Tax=Podospora pseudocomata TaxID=2093779 RepID=A0ABR0GTS0_9PEZI|nr:hypothetical protein QC762_0004760 [Podospora pseudocomata]
MTGNDNPGRPGPPPVPPRSPSRLSRQRLSSQPQQSEAQQPPSDGPRRTNAIPTHEDLMAGEDENLDVAPPAYGEGEHHDQLQLSQNGFAADAAVTSD